MLRGSLNRTRKAIPEWDLRKTEKYFGLRAITTFRHPVLPPFDTEAPPQSVIGDCWHRFYIRMREVIESIKIVEQAMTKYDALHAEGEKVKADFAARRPTLAADDAKKDDAALNELMKTKYSHRFEPPRTLTPGECYVETECPRGQMGFHVVGRPGKEAVPLRVRARSSSFCNLSVAGEICKGCLVADVPAIVGSIDVVMGEIDR